MSRLALSAVVGAAICIAAAAQADGPPGPDADRNRLPPPIPTHPNPRHAIRGTISFGADAHDLKAGTAVFVQAKHVDAKGNAIGVPVALDKLTYDGKDLPFVLDETKLVLVDGTLTGKLLVIGRYDQDGDGITKQPGDRTGSALVTVPATGVKLVLDVVQ